MGLNQRHEGRRVPAISLRSSAPTPFDVLSRLRALRQPHSAVGAASDLFVERSAAHAVEEFARRHMHVRDELAWKASQGEQLTAVERATLHALDSVLDSLEPGPAPLSREVQDIVRDALR